MKTTRRPMWMRLSAIVVAVSMLMCIFAGCQKKEPEKTPMEFLKDAINNTIDKATVQVEEAEIKDFCGSAEVKLNLTEIEMLKEALAGLEGIDIEAAAKIYFDTAKPAVALEASAGGSGLQIIDALLYLDPNDLALDVGGLLLSETYGIDLANFEKNFDSSIFGPNGAYSLGFSYDELMEVIGQASAMIAELPTADADMAAKAENMLKDLGDTLTKSVEENFEITKANGSVKLGGTEVKTVDVVLAGDAVAIYDVLEDLAIFYRDNEDARAIMEYSYEVFSLYDVYLGFESVDELYDVFDEFLAEIEEIKAEVAEEEAEMKLTFHVNADKNEFIGINLGLEIPTDKGEFEILWGPSMDDFNTIYVFGEQGEEKSEILLTIDEEKTDSKYSANAALSVVINGDTDVEAEVGVEWDKTSGAAAFYVEADGEELRAEANIKVDGDKTTVGLGKITIPNEEPVDLTGIYITINANDVMPAVPEYTDLLTMTEAEFDALIESITDLIDMFG